ncbi:RNA polymerase sigma-70 factor [Bacteroides fluxus]|jgi:RNA polymerase sigma-70 factor (ECF subfamily)
MSSQIKHVIAFNQLYEELSQRFIRFAKSYVMADEVAEDIVNDSFMYYWENRQYIADENISSYLLTVVKHKCINCLKHQRLEQEAKNRFQYLEEWELQLKISTLEACNPERLLSDEIQKLVRKALLSMSQQTRDILIRSRYLSQSNKEIAAQLGISVKSVEYHITKALKILRVILKDYFPIWLLYIQN